MKSFRKILNEGKEDYLDYEKKENQLSTKFLIIKWRIILQRCLKMLDMKDR